MIPGLSDVELVRRVTQDRDHAAFEALFNAHFGAIKRSIIGRFNCSTADAEDAAQHSFIRLWQNGASLQKDSAFPLLCTYAYHLMINRYRQTTAHPLQSLTPAKGEKPLDFPDVRETAEPDLPPMLPALRSAMNKLKPKDAEMLSLYFNGHTGAAVSQIVGVHEATVSRRIPSALRLLRRMLRVPEPKPTNYIIHSPAFEHRRKWMRLSPEAKERQNQHTQSYRQRKAYAACVSADAAIGSAADAVKGAFGKKPAVSVGLGNTPRKGEA